MEGKGTITLQGEDLKGALRILGKTAYHRATLPVLAGVKIFPTAEGIALDATDLELSARVHVSATVTGHPETILNARTLVDALKGSPKGSPVAFDVNAVDTLVNAGAGVARIRSAGPTEDFPSVSFAAAQLVGVSFEQFADACARVITAASDDQARPVLTGALLELEGDAFTITCTDSYRLHSFTGTLRSAACEPWKGIVPARALRILASMVTKTRINAPAGRILELCPDSGTITFRTGALELCSRLIEGEYPTWRQLPWPGKGDGTAVDVNAGELADIVARVGRFADKGSPVTLELEQGKCTVRASTVDKGETFADYSWSAPVLEHGTYGFNPEYFADALRAADYVGARATITFLSPLKPTAVESGSFHSIVMPVRLEGSKR